MISFQCFFELYSVSNMKLSKCILSISVPWFDVHFWKKKYSFRSLEDYLTNRFSFLSSFGRTKLIPWNVMNDFFFFNLWGSRREGGKERVLKIKWIWETLLNKVIQYHNFSYDSPKQCETFPFLDCLIKELFLPENLSMLVWEMLS